MRTAARPSDRRTPPPDAVGDVAGVLTPRDPILSETREPAGDGTIDRPADPDRHSAGLDGFGHLVYPIEGQLGRGVADLVFPPQPRAHLERLIQNCSALAEIDSGHVVFLTLPADTHPEIDTAT